MVRLVKNLLQIPFHPILWGIYPLASLYLANIAEVPFRAIGNSLIFSLATTLATPITIYLALCFCVVASKQKACFRIIVLILTLVIIYSPMYSILKGVTFHEVSVFRHRNLISLWVLVFVLLLIYELKPDRLIKGMKDTNLWEGAAAFSSIFLILFFSYGHVFNILNKTNDSQYSMIMHSLLIRLWIAIFLASLFLLWKSGRASLLTPALNSISSILLIITLAQIVIWKVQSSTHTVTVSPTNPPAKSTSESRDIYYIILDGYGRSDYLREEFDFDNSAFLTELESLGFVIPECAQSNYHVTILSMTSSLNMNYLTELPPGRDTNSSYFDFEPYLEQSLVLNFFENLGYETFTFSGLTPYTMIPDSTHFYDVPKGEVSIPSIDALNFYYLFLQTTALRPLLDYFEQTPKPNPYMAATLGSLLPSDDGLMNRHYWRYQQNVYHLNVLESIPELPGKKFVYAHLYATHDPFVFTPEGDFRQGDTQSKDAYRDQILFMNKRIPDILRTIIAKSIKSPIIIVQADHGGGWDNNWVRILNAYYLPDGGNAGIYPTITPVNTFRLIINEYFNGTYRLLPDISFNGPYGDRQTRNLSIVPTTCTNP